MRYLQTGVLHLTAAMKNDSTWSQHSRLTCRTRRWNTRTII